MGKQFILVGCEESQAVCKALRERGHIAFSCDLQECSGGHPEWHLQMDVFQAIEGGLLVTQSGELVGIGKWGMLICFPPCTDLSSAGAPSWKIKQEDGRQQAAIDFVIKLFNTDCALVAIENPVGILSTVWKKPTQIINPYEFGEPFKKRTCLWLKGLPKLIPTNIVAPKYHHTSNSTRGGLLKDGTRKKSFLPIRKNWDTAKERSKTFEGIAKAMAEQWAPQAEAVANA